MRWSWVSAHFKLCLSFGWNWVYYASSYIMTHSNIIYSPAAHGVGHCPLDGFTDWNVYNIHGKVHAKYGGPRSISKYDQWNGKYSDFSALYVRKYMTRVVRKSPSSRLKNRVILANWKYPQLVEMLKNACMFGVKRSRNSLGNQKISACKDANKVIILTQG